MKLKDVLKSAAALLGNEKACEYLADNVSESEASAQTLSDINAYVRLANVVICELAGSYVPMKTVEAVTPVNGRVYFSSLNKRVLRITAFYDRNGNALDFTVYPEYAETGGSAVTAEYEYSPDNYGLTDDIGYEEKDVSSAALSYGVAAEVCLSQSRFEEAVLWRERYAECVRSFVLPKGGKIKSRCWL